MELAADVQSAVKSAVCPRPNPPAVIIPPVMWSTPSSSDTSTRLILEHRSQASDSMESSQY